MIDWLMFKANISSISAILWQWIFFFLCFVFISLSRMCVFILTIINAKWGFQIYFWKQTIPFRIGLIWSSEWVIVDKYQLSNCSAISWWEQANFQWNDEEVHFVLDQHQGRKFAENVCQTTGLATSKTCQSWLKSASPATFHNLY